MLQKYFVEALDIVAPIVTRKLTRTSISWITPELEKNEQHTNLQVKFISNTKS